VLDFIETFQSVVIATIDCDGNPFSSYAPFVRYEHRYYVFISDIARHSCNLRETPKASLFFIEDEGTAENIFARKRVSLQCESRPIPRDAALFAEVIGRFKTRFDPGLVGMLEGMKDFNLFAFSPFSGEAVFGFGKAYDIGGDFMENLLERRGAGGHKK
jgi:putative heme iron utilization protein